MAEVWHRPFSFGDGLVCSVCPKYVVENVWVGVHLSFLRLDRIVQPVFADLLCLHKASVDVLQRVSLEKTFEEPLGYSFFYVIRIAI